MRQYRSLESITKFPRQRRNPITPRVAYSAKERSAVQSKPSPSSVDFGAPGGIRIRGLGQPKPPAINGFPRSVNPKGRYAKPGYTTGAVSCRRNGFFYLLPDEATGLRLSRGEPGNDPGEMRVLNKLSVLF